MTSNQESDQPNSNEKSDSDWCDLAAQQSMAESTRGMHYAAWAGVAFTILGVFLIWRTLEYTRYAADAAADAVVEAKNATKAAQDTVSATREIGQAQVRAYLTITKATFEADVVAPERSDSLTD